MAEGSNGKRDFKLMHVEPLVNAYTMVIGRKEDGRPTPISMNQASMIADALITLNKQVAKIDIVRDELRTNVGENSEEKVDQAELDVANAKFKELLDQDIEMELPVLDGKKLEEDGVMVDVDSVFVLKHHELIT